MLDITTCDSCNHVKVCGKKDKYKQYFEALEKACISPSDKSIMYAKDDADVFVELKCKHYEKHNPISMR